MQWPLSFAGAIGILTTIIWMVFVYDDPSKHPHISFKEKMYLLETTALRTGGHVRLAFCTICAVTHGIVCVCKL